MGPLPCSLTGFLWQTSFLLIMQRRRELNRGNRRMLLALFIFTPYYDHSPPLWEVVANSMSYFQQYCHHQKGCISREVRSLLPALTYPQWYTRLPLVRLLLVSSVVSQMTVCSSVRTSYKLDCEFAYIIGWPKIQIPSLEFIIINSIQVHL